MVDDLDPGDYVIIPTTFKEGKTGSFNLSVWMSYPVNLSALD